MSSKTLQRILENWTDGLAGFDDQPQELPFDVESFCRQMDAEIDRLRARVAELEKELEDLSNPLGPLPPKGESDE